MNDLIRAETLFRDRKMENPIKKTKLQNDLVVVINVDDILLVFRFEGKVMKLGDGNKIDKVDESTFRIYMNEIYEEDVVSDIRERIIAVIEKMIIQDHKFEIANEEKNILLELAGGRNFKVKQEQFKGSPRWDDAEEFDRLIKFVGVDGKGIEKCNGELQMKLERFRGVGHFPEDNSVNLYDCYSLYKH